MQGGSLFLRSTRSSSSSSSSASRPNLAAVASAALFMASEYAASLLACSLRYSSLCLLAWPPSTRLPWSPPRPSLPAPAAAASLSISSKSLPRSLRFFFFLRLLFLPSPAASFASRAPASSCVQKSSMLLLTGFAFCRCLPASPAESIARAFLASSARLAFSRSTAPPPPISSAAALPPLAPQDSLASSGSSYLESTPPPIPSPSASSSYLDLGLARRSASFLRSSWARRVSSRTSSPSFSSPSSPRTPWSFRVKMTWPPSRNWSAAWEIFKPASSFEPYLGLLGADASPSSSPSSPKPSCS
mmetsp:Transcript_9545/g.34105  ORF Transcript_9545/g.34105 Transcript_9545/m.34105 type:complete len:302 (+) Transcript_9545:1285-2190(+)